MKFFKLSLIATALATLLATQTSAIITPFGELTSETFNTQDGCETTFSYWKPKNEHYRIKYGRRETCAEPTDIPQGYDDISTMPADTLSGYEITRMRSKYNGNCTHIYEIWEDHISRATVRYWVGTHPFYELPPEAWYHKAAKELLVACTLSIEYAFKYTYEEPLGLRAPASQNNEDLLYKYNPIISDESGPILNDADVEIEITRNRGARRVIALYHNAVIDPKAKYYITPNAIDGHIQLAPKIPIPIQPPPTVTSKDLYYPLPDLNASYEAMKVLCPSGL
ncbi:MAG: hypothetical protein LBJ95_04375 [Oscillospiraceae bacterium]|jgi:hypothetical protein|nr:hypothetical protein [Oscillospiraceae bacterium]